MATDRRGSPPTAGEASTLSTRPSTSSEAAEFKHPATAGSKLDPFDTTQPVNPNLTLVDRHGTSSLGSSKAASRDPPPAGTTGTKEGEAKYDASKCKCCEKPLYSGANCLPMVPKYNRCSTCSGYVCRHCKGECHECIARKQLVLEPEEMLQTDRHKLVRLLETLHYPKKHFDNWEKPFLVKQMLTRFHVHEDWTPRPASVISTKSMKTSQQDVDLKQKEKAEDEEASGQPPSKSINSSSSAKFYDKDKSTGLQPGTSQAQIPSKGYDSVKKSKTKANGTYQDIRMVVDDLPPSPSALHKAEKQVKEEQKSRKGSRILDMIKSPKKGTADKNPEKTVHVPELHVPKHDSPKLVKKPEFMKSKGSLSSASTPSRPTRVDHVNIMDKLDYSLKDISSSKDIDELPLKQLKIILGRHGLDTKAIATEEDMRYTVKRIWNYRRQKENDAKISESMEELGQIGKQRVKAKSKPLSTSESQLSTKDPEKMFAVGLMQNESVQHREKKAPAGKTEQDSVRNREKKPPEVDLNRQSTRHRDKKELEAPRTRIKPEGLQLEALFSFKAIENMESSHLISTLRKHNINPSKYETHQELVYAVRCLWRAIHASDNKERAGTGPSKRDDNKSQEKSEKPAIPAAKETKSHYAKIQKFPSISDIKSVMELEMLTVEKLSEILKRYSINPGQYTEKHELYYAVLLLWNNRKLAAKEEQKNIHSASGASENHKSEYVKSWLLKHDDVVEKQPETEARPLEQKRKTKPRKSSTEEVLKTADNSEAIQQLTDQKSEAIRQVIGSTPIRSSERKREPKPHKASTEEVLKIADNSAAIQQLTDEKSEAIRQVIGSTPIMGTQLDAKRKKNSLKVTRVTEKHDRANAAAGTLKTEAVRSKYEAAKEHGASTDILKTARQRDDGHPAASVIYTEVLHGSQNQPFQGAKRVTAKLERQAEVVYAELVPSPKNIQLHDDACSSIFSFGDRIAPESTELEFAFIDDTLSEMSVLQGSPNRRKTSSTSSYYSKLLDVQNPK